jgi:outer membrane lipoprotein-sorting protein
MERSSAFKRSVLGSLALLVLLGGAVQAMELKEIKKAIEGNLSRVKSLSCEVEIAAVTGAGSLRQAFSLQYKYPHRLRTASLASPDLVYISRKDTSFFKNRLPSKMDESLIATVRPDAQGRLFNPASLLDASLKSSTAPCGQKICVSFTGEVSSQVADSVKKQLGIGRFSGSLEYSPEKRIVESFTLLSGPAATTTKIQYQEVGGVHVPQVMEMQVQGMRTTIRFDKVKLNIPIPDREFQ